MDRLGRRGEGPKDVGHAGGRVSREPRTHQKVRSKKGSVSERPA